jgi:hypothetical protein
MKRIKQIRTAMINAITWLSVSDDANIPAEAYTEARKNRPIKAPRVPPLSMFPGCAPR